VLEYATFFRADEEVAHDPEAVARWIVKPGALDLLRDAGQALAEAPEAADAATIERLVSAFLEPRGLAPGKLAQALRVAATGRGVGFGLYDALAILGPRGAARRIAILVERVRASAA
jgi:hypothetical protein